MRRRKVEKHLTNLGEISEIMAAMKNLSFMETRKLSRFLGNQQRVAQSIEQTAVGFLRFHSELLPATESLTSVYLIVGSERGFCGNFNGRLLETYHAHSGHAHNSHTVLIPVGTKLCAKLEPGEPAIEQLPGVSVAEEVPRLLDRLADVIKQLQLRQGPLKLIAIHHGETNDEIQLTSLLPPFQESKFQKAAYGYPPVMYLTPRRLLGQLVDYYLFAALHAMLYTSLLAEHQQRIQHLEGAIDRLQNQSKTFRKKRNALRQEEITEEIEMIMLSAEAVDDQVKSLI